VSPLLRVVRAAQRGRRVLLRCAYRLERAGWLRRRGTLFVLGNEKSGTSAIASLLGAVSGASTTIDIPGTWEPVQTRLHSGLASLDDVVLANPVEFSRRIVKEPVLTFELEGLRRAFPEAGFVLVVRDPRENIRSILNRLGLPGDAAHLTPQHIESVGAVWSTWRTVIYNGWLGIPQEHYIESLAGRWNVAADVHLQNHGLVELARYEDFIRDKPGYIRGLAERCRLPIRRPIEHLVDVQYQPRGQTGVSWQVFFGRRNLDRITEVCGRRMALLGYTE
jgi:hypothetical protein